MKRRFYPSLDRLEDRTVPAGNVSVSFNEGLLRILGDAEDNQISILGDGNGNVTVTGLGDTTLNGGTNDLNFSGVKKSLEVWMRGGNDSVTISNLDLKRTAFIHMGDGDDLLNVNALKTRRTTEIWAGAGNDQLNIENSTFKKAGYVAGGAGDDTVNLADNYFGRKSIIGGGDGTDSLGGINNDVKSRSQVINFEDHVSGAIPTALADEATVDEGAAVDIDLAVNDDTFRGTLDLTSIVITTQPANGTIEVNDDGTVTYTHNGSNTTTDSFEYTIENSYGNVSQPATVTITVNPVNDAPVAVNDAATIAEGGNAAINVAANDTDADGTINLTSIVIVTQPTNGTVVVNNDGTVTYTHNGSETTSDSFTYNIKDNNGLVSNNATVTLTITPVNDAPVAVNDAATLNEGAVAAVNVANNDTDADGTIDATSIVIVAQPTNGSVVVNNDGTVTYTHNGSETTSDSFTYTIKDNNGLVSNVATVTLTITPVNDPPVAVNDFGLLVNNGNTVINAAANDTDVDGTIDVTSIVIVAQPTNGTVVVNADGTITYTHNGSATTTDSFTYTIKDNDGLVSNVATVNLSDTPPNQPPVAVNDADTVAEGANVVINLATNDTDADGTIDVTSITIVAQPTNGIVVVNADGTVTYTHNGSETTSDSFTYTIKDNDGDVSNTATVAVTITPVDDAPVANDDADSLDEGANANINVANNDTDADGTIDLTSIVIVNQPANGSVVVNANGTVTYTHNGSETTSDTFTYTIKDNNGNVSNQATVTLTITLTNDAPVAVNDVGNVVNFGNTNINLASNDTDADGTIDVTSILIVDQPDNGTVVVNADGTVTYTHNGTATTTDTFTYTIKDNLGLVSNVATVNITIA